MPDKMPSIDSRQTPGIVRLPDAQWVKDGQRSDIPSILPHERVFPIQIGNELFRLSGASLSSDAPSYFSQFFKCQLAQDEEREKRGEEPQGVHTLYIDRDPATFADIARHLQGYHISPKDGAHFVKLFADAQFYQLPRLMSQLYEDNIYISIGGREFHVQKSLFTAPGDTPNYFTLGFGFMFSNAETVFPGLDREGLLRPPSIVPPAVPGRSSEIFAQLIHMLKGYPIHVINECHRAELLRDCRYFMFKGLEQKLIRHHISYNYVRDKSEITVGLEDIRQPGLSVVFDPPDELAPQRIPRAWVHYQRPFVDSIDQELVLEIGNEVMEVHLCSMQAHLRGDAKKRFSRLYEVVTSKTKVANGAVEDRTTVIGDPAKFDVQFDESTSITLDGQTLALDGTDASLLGALHVHIGDEEGERKRKRSEHKANEKWIVKTGQWRLRVDTAPPYQGRTVVRCLLVAVKLDAYTSEFTRNEERRFLGGGSGVAKRERGRE